MKVEFTPLQEEHLSLLRQWLREPHVAEFWQETENDNELREKFLKSLPMRGVSPFVIVLDAKPIGYIQHYEAKRVGGGWWPDATDGTFGIDQFIGEPTMINRGYGTIIIRRFIEQIFGDAQVEEIITDPDPKNARAIRAYEKAGFLRAGEIKTPGGDALLLRIRRENLANDPSLLTHVERIPVNGGQLAAYSFGQGPPVIFLHGGPGDTHHYMKRMAEPLFRDFRCIFFDQRGTGGSAGFKREPEQFHLELLFEDLLAVSERFGTGLAALVGHSWGAMYALFSCIRYPGRFKKAALLSMGPLDAEMERGTSEHMTSVLNEKEKEEWQSLRSTRNRARDQGQFDKVEALDKELMRLRVMAWVFNPALRKIFLNEYFQDPPPDREVNKWIWDSLDGWFSWERLNSVRTLIWVCAGANDSVPIVQAQRVAETMPTARLTVFDRCGHIPWLEHSKDFYGQLEQFLKSEEGAG